MKQPHAVVMNMFYTGLGIARSLGEQGIPVIGLTAKHGVYGNFTRYAKVMHAPDSRSEPEALLAWLREFGRGLETRAVLFPTRDHDVVFLDRYRESLAPYYSPVVAPAAALAVCVDKWRTYEAAVAAGVATPQCWLVANRAELERAAGEIPYPCVMKPVAAFEWREGGNWQLVGARKAIGISSREELLCEYEAVAQAGERVLLQEMIPGDDDCLMIAACYMDRSGSFAAGFNTQKLVQIPAGFGTGCIVQGAHRPELFAPAVKLLESIGYRGGIAEVEFKWDARRNEFRLIEVNPRPWDQHSLGRALGVDLMRAAYADHAGLPAPRLLDNGSEPKWIAEDAFIMAALRCLWHRDFAGLRALFRLVRGRRTYAMWSLRDPLPALGYITSTLIPDLFGAVGAVLGRPFRAKTAGAPQVAVKERSTHA